MRFLSRRGPRAFRSRYCGWMANADIMLYGYESLQEPSVVVSLTGSICMIFIPVTTAQSTSRRKSPKSPTPQELLLRRENTGTETPAARQVSSRTLSSSPYITKTLPSGTDCWSEGSIPSVVRLSPSSQATRVCVASSTMTYLNSIGSGMASTFTERSHSHIPNCSICR